MRDPVLDGKRERSTRERPVTPQHRDRAGLLGAEPAGGEREHEVGEQTAHSGADRECAGVAPGGAHRSWRTGADALAGCAARASRAARAGWWMASRRRLSS